MNQPVHVTVQMATVGMTVEVSVRMKPCYIDIESTDCIDSMLALLVLSG